MTIHVEQPLRKTTDGLGTVQDTGRHGTRDKMNLGSDHLFKTIFYAADATPTRTRAPTKAPTLTPTCAAVALLSEFDFNRRYANQANSMAYQKKGRSPQ